MRLLPILLSSVLQLSTIRLTLQQREFKSADTRSRVHANLREALRRMEGGVPPLLDPVRDQGIASESFTELVQSQAGLAAKLKASPLHASPSRDAVLAAAASLADIHRKRAVLATTLAECTSLAQRETLKRMSRVLRRLGHVSAEGIVTSKGRVAAEINTADELLITELVFSNAFKDLDVPTSGALLSCLVCTDKSPGAKGGDKAPPPLPEMLAGPLRTLSAAARHVAEVAVDCKIPLDPEEYVAGFKPDMMVIVHAWVSGAKFVEICAMTKEFEGTIIRVIRRLEELTRQLADAAKAIGDSALEAKFKEASSKIR